MIGVPDLDRIGSLQVTTVIRAPSVPNRLVYCYIVPATKSSYHCVGRVELFPEFLSQMPKRKFQEDDSLKRHISWKKRILDFFNFGHQYEQVVQNEDNSVDGARIHQSQPNSTAATKQNHTHIKGELKPFLDQSSSPSISDDKSTIFHSSRSGYVDMPSRDVFKQPSGLPNSHISKNISIHRRQSSALRRAKLRKRKKNLADKVREISNYDDMVRGGFKSSRRDYNELLNYAVKVQMAMQNPKNSTEQSHINPSSLSSSPVAWSMASSTTSRMSHSPKNMLHSSSFMSLASDNLSQPFDGSSMVSSLKSQNSYIFKPPSTKKRSVPLVEQTWIKELREKIQSALNTKIEIEEPPTPTFDKIFPTKVSSYKVIEPFPDISPKMEAAIKAAFAKSSGNVVEAFNIPITPHDIGKLRDRQWLNDEVINFYHELIRKRSQDHAGLFPKVHVFNTFFYPRLQSKGYSGVRRWTRKIDIFSFDYIIIPVHLSVHWCCAVINFKEKRFEYYDSLHGPSGEAFQVLRDYLCKESLDKRKLEIDLSEWSNFGPKNIPAQENGYDCGVFACTFAEYISRGAYFDFDQSHMKYLRNRMAYEIISKRLIHQP